MLVHRGILLGVGLALSAVVACSSDSTSGGSQGSGGNSGGACFPTSATCYGTNGVGGPGHECLAKSDNSGSTTWNGRISQILVTKPSALATKYIQESVIDKGVDLDMAECFGYGQGTFSWLFQFDSQSNKLKTGGGLPVTDPTKPACFAVLPNAQIPVAPTTIDITVDADSFTASNIDLVVPIFLTPTDTTKIVLLPVHGGEVKGTWSADHNCIGKFNGDTLDAPLCLPDTTTEPPVYTFTNGGTITGYITVDEADTVFVDTLNESLCVLLAGPSTWKGPDGYCKTSDAWIAGQRPDGDWCKATNAAAGTTCKDSYHLEAGFAASAYPISGDCP